MLVLALLHPVVDLTSWRWSIHPSTVIGIAALGAVYLLAASRTQRQTTPAQKIYFFSGTLGAVYLWGPSRLQRQPTRPQAMPDTTGLELASSCRYGPIHDLSDDYLF